MTLTYLLTLIGPFVQLYQIGWSPTLRQISHSQYGGIAMRRSYQFIVLLFALLVASGARSQVTQIQVTPTGSATGACTGSGVTILTPTQFNLPSNWGNASGKIGKGTHILVCGTFTGAAGTTGLIFQGGGASGAPIDFACDTGTNFTAPYWGQYPGGAIVDNGYSYIVINGANCTIQNTENGTPGFAYHSESTGIYVNDATNVTVENFLIENICQVTGGSGCGSMTSSWDHGIYLTNISNTVVQGNTIHDTNDAIQYNCSQGTDTNNSITKNTITRANWGAVMSDNGSTSGCSNMTISYNDISDFSNWDSTGGHHDPIICYIQPSSGKPTMSNLSIYGNYIHGDMGSGASAMGMFIQENDSSGNATAPPDGGTFVNLNIFNNVIVNGRSIPTYGNGLIGTSGGHIFNNMFDCNQNNDGAIWINQDNGAIIENNVIQNCQLAFYIASSGITASAINYNVLYNLSGGSYSECEVGSSSSCVMLYGNTPYKTVAAWTAATGFDANSTLSNPDLTSSYMLGSSSSAIGLGKNLTNLDITALNTSAPQYFGASYACGTGCVARPSTGAWDAGAYQFSSGGTAGRENPPSGLTAVVQ
jgi:Right handed beta helix region